MVDRTSVKTAARPYILEQAGYIECGRNMPHIYASSIQGRDMTEVREKIEGIADLSKLDKEKTVTIVNSLMGEQTMERVGGDR